METQEVTSSKSVEQLDSVVVRFAGDSGDGIQLTGSQFTAESAIAGNDIATLPNFPAEIRAPAGTIAGVSGFQINFGSLEIYTPGDKPDVLVAFNPAALKANLGDLKPGGIIIANEDTFTDKNLQKVGYESNPLEDNAIQESYKLIIVPISKLTKEALKDSGLGSKDVERCKNFFALGIMLWMFNRPTEETIKWIDKKFAKKQEYADANKTALKAGMTYAEATEIFEASFEVKPASLAPGVYKNISGTTAMSYGFVAAGLKSKLPMFFGAYPITPASDLLHELAKHKQLGIQTFQAEDEIAAICASIGASYAGSLSITSSSGPGISLKAEALGLAVCAELPLVIVNVQRAGPSTGLPTKTEQADLMQALNGRHGEAPLCILAASSPSTAFSLAYEACRIATKYMTPVMLLSDGYITNGSEPWSIPDATELKDFEVKQITEPNAENGEFLPYLRDENTLARPWATPGTPGLMHRIGGLEKEENTGNVSYDPDNHHRMGELRAEKIARIAQEIPPLEIDGPESGELLVIGWGGTAGSIKEAVKQSQADGLSVSHVHIHHISPLPSDLGDIIKRFKRVLVPEINFGQLIKVIRSNYLVDAQGFNIVKGLPLSVSDLTEEIRQLARPQ